MTERRSTMASTPGPVPARIRVRMYQVGFGDCLLVSFEYDEPLEDDRRERHILVDFGSTRLPTGLKDLMPIARRIQQDSSGQLDVVVLTHRHKDHLSAFGNGDIASILAGDHPPRLVVRAWTEDPDAEADFQGVTDGEAPREHSLAFRSTLASAQSFSDTLATAIQGAPRSVAGDELKQLAADQLANADAVKQLEKWAEDGRGAYLHYGMASGIEELIPGIRVSVLGPPTVEQHPAVRSQRDEDPDEFWMIYSGLVGTTEPLELLRMDKRRSEEQADPATAPEVQIGPVRWIIDRMGRQQIQSFLRIVRILDKALNNTSVILLFEADTKVGTTKRMLFCGDAQIENWEYALKVAPDRKENLDRLRLVDLYKVGHHGSRNATPRTLFNLWGEPETIDRPMTALMSTKSGVHGEHPETRVPRATLVAALDNRMELYSTECLGREDQHVEVMADLSTDEPFKKVAPVQYRPCR